MSTILQNNQNQLNFLNQFKDDALSFLTDFEKGMIRNGRYTIHFQQFVETKKIEVDEVSRYHALFIEKCTKKSIMISPVHMNLIKNDFNTIKDKFLEYLQSYNQVAPNKRNEPNTDPSIEKLNL